MNTIKNKCNQVVNQSLAERQKLPGYQAGRLPEASRICWLSGAKAQANILLSWIYAGSSYREQEAASE